jgi:hypothetical protein
MAPATPGDAPTLHNDAPAREVRLRLTDAGRQSSVEVLVKDQAGEVRVAVRTHSSELAQSLREGLPELVGRLGQSGFDTQVWRPASADARSQPATRDGLPREAAFSGGAPDHGGSGQDQAGSEEDRQPDHRDHSSQWNEEYENSFGPPGNTTDRSNLRWLHPWMQ